MLKKILWSIVLVFWGCTAFTQSEIPIGSWKSHLAYQEGFWVAQSDINIFYAAAKGLFILNKTENSTRFLSTEDGLSDVSISKIYFDSFNKQLIIVYNDSNIDILLEGDEIINVPAVKDNRTIIGSKTIHDFKVVNQNIAYLATDFGILSFDLKRYEFVNTTFTPFAVNSIGVLDQNILAGTDEGLYSILISDNNPADFGRWKKIGTEFALPEVYKASFVAGYRDKIYLVIDNSLLEGSLSEPFNLVYSLSGGYKINFLSTGEKYLLIGARDFDNNRSRIDYLDEEGVLKTSAATCLARLTYAVEDKSGKIWFSDEWSPIKYADQITTGCQFIEYNSPRGNQAGEINFKGDRVFIAGGGITEDYQNPQGSYGFYQFEDKLWTNYLPDNFPEIAQYEMAYIQTVIPHPKKNELYIGSFWNGIMKWNLDEETIEHYNKDNTNRVLLPRVGDTLRTRIPFMVFDNKDNLWMCNFGASKPLVVWEKDGTWKSFAVPGNNNLAKITIDKNQNKWISVQGVGNGLLVFNEGKDLDDTSDDKFRYITSANSEIVANRVHTVVADLNGSVWVGTSEGPVIFDCPDPFDEKCTGSTRKVIEDGIPAILLKTEDILSIAVDGANRKWLGTRNGIFVLAPSGDTLIAKYDTKNSPLLDNVVRILSFNGETGEMWMYTNNGIQSVRTTSTLGGRVHEDVHVFPNPVRPEYMGPIAIKGLVRDAIVKITDLNGRLIFETTADGGQAIWYGKDYTGNQVVSGVYLVFSSSQEIVNNPETLVTKILVIR